MQAFSVNIHLQEMSCYWSLFAQYLLIATAVILTAIPLFGSPVAILRF